MASSSPKSRLLDVRPFIARGQEPFTKIMATVAALAPGESFVLITPFIPAPLIEKLQSEGFSARPEHQTDGSWHTQFVAPQR